MGGEMAGTAATVEEQFEMRTPGGLLVNGSNLPRRHSLDSAPLTFKVRIRSLSIHAA